MIRTTRITAPAAIAISNQDILNSSFLVRILAAVDKA